MPTVEELASLLVKRRTNGVHLPGVKKIRARLYYEAGLDTLEKMAACDPEGLRKISAEYIKKTSFKGVPPTTKEAEHTVNMAKYKKKYVE